MVFFTPAFHDKGGVAQRSRLLAAGFADRGWHVTVIARATMLRRPTVCRGTRLRVVELPGFGVERLATVSFLALGLPLGVLLGWRARVFLAIKLHSSSTAAAGCAALRGIPFVALATSSGPGGEVAHLFGEAGRPGQARPAKPSHARLRRSLLARAALVVAQTQAAIPELARLVPADRIAVVPTPVQPVQAPPLTGAPLAVYTGRLSAQKGLAVLLEAWAEVARHRPDAGLALVGDGGAHEPVEEELRRMVAGDPRLSSTVRFTGWLGDVTGELCRSDVFVLPSLSEGMSNSLLEACAYRRVVVASDIPANRAVLGEDYPLLFPAGDARSLAATILAAMGDGKVRERALANVDNRMGAFSADRVIERLERLVLRAAGERDALHSGARAGA